MAKVVGRDDTTVKRVTCRECAAIIEYTPHEVKEFNGTDYSGGQGDLWLVVAAWDLTEVERAALQSRVTVN